MWKPAVSGMEEAQKGVYFEVESMTFSDYEARRERGEKADMCLVSTWMGVYRGASAHRYENAGNAGRYGGFLPVSRRRVWGTYAASGYVLAVNSRIIQEKGLDMDMLCGMIRSGEAKASGDEIIACIYGAKGELGDGGFF